MLLAHIKTLIIFYQIRAICKVGTPPHETVGAFQNPFDCLTSLIISISNSLTKTFVFGSFMNRDLTFSLTFASVFFGLIHHAFVMSLFSNF